MTDDEKRQIEQIMHMENIRAKTAIVDRRDFYLYTCSDEKKAETKARLTEIVDAGMTEVGVAEFGVRGIMSGLYIEKVWRFSDEEWRSYMEWAKGLIKRHKDES